MEYQPLISIIVPVYNPGRYFRTCIESLIHQSYKNLEIILVDDGSEDGSEIICDEYAKKDQRIIVLHQKNGGVSRARNSGIAVATGDYYYFPDSDDYIELDTVEYLLGITKEHECDVVNFEHFITYPENETAHYFKDSSRYGLFDAENALRQLVTGVQFTCNKFFKKKLITGNANLPGIKFREDILRGEDTLFSVQAILRAERIWFDSKPLYHYVQSPESACRGRFRPNQLSILKLYDAYEPLYKEKYPEIWTLFLINMQEQLISLYYDIWSDIEDYTQEKITLYTTFKKYQKLVNKKNMSKKQTVKLALFNISPALFCITHKLMHRL